MKNASKWGNVIVSLFLFLVPLSSYATVSITEIMYDAEGADTKHEWIEIWNDGAATDVSEWKLFEGSTNHKLTIFAGSATVPAGGYAIIADDAVTFLADYPSFSGIVFDTAFSGGLNNSTGETLTLRDSALADKHTVTYDPSVGAGGDGNSLQKIGSAWQSGTPTPGSAGSGGAQPPAEEEEEETAPPPQTHTNTATAQQLQSAPVVPQIRALAGDDRTVVAGASSIFSGAAAGLKGEPLQDARFVWSFGNGDRKEGQSVLYTFLYPGTYAVTLDVSSGAWSATDRVVVTVIAANVAVTNATSDFIELENRSTQELDLGMWQLSVAGKTFIFPAHTILLLKTKVRVSALATGLSASSPRDVSLLYPNGTHAAGYQAPLFITQEPIPTRIVSKTSVPAVRTEVLGDAPEAETAGSVLGASTKASEPVPYFVWFLGLLALIGGGWGAAYLIRKKLSRP